MRMLPVGDVGLLIELDDLAATQAVHRELARAWRHGQAPGVEDLVPAARTVLIRFDPRRLAGHQVQAWAETVLAGAGPTVDGAGGPLAGDDRPVLEVPVHYDGADLEQVARRTGLGVAGVIEAHGAMCWTVAFSGFSPGFGYLVGGDVRLRVPRLARPRVRVPAGSVALAGEYCGVYPVASPGGWQLIGHTEIVIWDVEREPPALLAPGVRVRFVRADAR